MKQFLFLIFLTFSFSSIASINCNYKTDYPTGFICSGKVIVNNQQELDDYLVDYGLSNGDWRKLEINFALVGGPYQIHSPCKIIIAKDLVHDSSLICLDGKEGVYLNRNNKFNGSLGIISELEKIQIDRDFVADGNSLKIQSGLSNVVIDRDNQITYTDSLIVESSDKITLGNNSQISVTNGDLTLKTYADEAPINISMGSSLSSRNMTLSSLGNIIVDKDSTFSATNRIEIENQSSLYNSKIDFGKNIFLSSQFLDVASSGKILFDKEGSYSATKILTLSNISADDNIVIERNNIFSSENTNILASDKIKIEKDASLISLHHLHADASNCVIDSSVVFSGNTESGTCFNLVNDAPVLAGDQNEKTPVNTQLAINLLGATDTNNDHITYFLEEPLIGGVVTGCFEYSSSTSCLYLPNNGFNGIETIKYKANDGNLDSVTFSEVKIIVNTEPTIISDQSFDTSRNTPVIFDLTGGDDIDVDNSTLTYFIETSPQNGVLTGCMSYSPSTTCTYTPNPNFSGVDFFTYNVSDGIESSTTSSRVDLKVNTAPVMAGDQSFSTDEDTSFSISLNGATDLDNDPLLYEIVTAPINGVLTDCLNNTGDLSCNFAPGDNFNGIISFSYRAFDGDLYSETNSVVTLTINAINDAPVMIEDQIFSVNEDTALSLTLSGATDIDSASLTYNVVSNGAGTLSNCLNASGDLTCTFLPNQDFNGQTSFTYLANDGSLNSTSVSTVTINVTPVNDAPVMIGDQSFITDEDIPLSITLSGANDVDLDTLTYSIVSNTSDATISNCLQSNGDLVCDFIPNSNFNGTASFSYRANDGLLNSSTASTVTVVINPVNDIPVMIGDQSFSTSEDNLVSIVLNGATDIEGTSLVYDVVTASPDGQLNNCLAHDGDLVCDFLPNLDFNGSTSFTYKANDGTADSSSVSIITINVAPVNDAPVMVSNQTFSTNEDSSINITLSGATDVDLDTLSYSVFTSSTDGTLSNCLNSDGDLNCDFLPNLNFNGPTTFTYKANDGTVDSVLFSTVTINVNAVNDAPVMLGDQSFLTDEDSPISITLLGASDVDSASLTYSVVTDSTDGVLTNCLSNDDDLICYFDPNLNFNGVTSFTYKANDGALDSAAVSTVTITVNPVNDAPVMLGDQSFSTDEDTPVSVTLLGASDVDSAALNYSIVTASSDGDLTNCLSNDDDLICDFVPNLNFNGPTTFTYKANDGALDSPTVSTVTITVNAVNDAPVMLGDQSFTTDEDTLLSVTLLGASDVDSVSLTYSIVTASTDGTLTNCLNSNDDLICDFSPNLNFNGSTSFTYIANDGSLDSTTVSTVTITVNAVNDAPVMITDQAFLTDEDTSVSITLSGATDVDNNPLTYSLVTASTDGALTNCLSNDDDLICDFQPNLNFNGTTSFSYKANDGLVDSVGVSTVTITVNPVNDAPVMIGDQSVTTDEDTLVSVTLLGATDVDSALLNYSVVTASTDGALTNCLNNDNDNDLICDFQPNLNFNGTTTFTYKANDGEVDSSSISTVTITVNPVNDAPVMIADQSITTDEDTLVSVTLSGASDVDNNPLTYSVVTASNDGVLTNCLNSDDDLVCDFRPNLNFNGSTSFTYKANDGVDDSISVSTVSIIVNPVNDAPVMIGDQAFSTDEDTLVSITLLGATDVDSGALTYSLVTASADGTISNCLNSDDDLVCDFTPNIDFNGSTSFTYKAHDGDANSISISTITITVNPVNDAPIMVGDQSLLTEEDTLLSITLLGATDADNNPLTYSVVTDSTDGSLSNCLNTDDDLVCEFTPNLNFNGTTSFTYKANDGEADSNSISTVTITVNAVNDAPVMVGDQTFSTDEDSLVSITLLGATDVESNPLTFSLVTASTDGALSNCLNNDNDLVCDFTPNLDFNGSTSFTYKANDGSSDSVGISTVTISVNAVNDAPVMAVDQSFSTDEDTLVSITLIGATDVDNNPLTYSVVTAPSDGVLTNCLSSDDDLVCDFQPNLNFNGSTSFTYKANDGLVDSVEVSTVTITVNPVNDAPILIGSQNIDAIEDESISISVAQATDVENDEITYSIVNSTNNGILLNCLSSDTDLDCDYYPNPNFFGLDSFSYVAYDGNSNSITSTVNINVVGVNDAPVMGVDQTFEMDQDTTLNFTVSNATDVEGDALSYNLLVTPVSGAVVNCMNGTTDRTCDYTPGVGFFGDIVIRYTADDQDTGTEKLGTINITVKSTNRLPVMIGDQEINLSEDGSIQFSLLGANDLDNDQLTYKLVDLPTSGSLSNCADNTAKTTCSFLPAPDFFGRVTFSYVGSDGKGEALTPSIVSLIVSPVNDLPVVADNYSLDVEMNTPLNFNLSIGSDLDEDNLSYIVVQPPLAGVLSECAEGTDKINCVYTPSPDFTGIDSFTYKINDGVSDSAAVTVVTLNVSESNIAPTIGGDQRVVQVFSLDEDTSIAMPLVGGVDDNGDSLTYWVSEPPKFGTLSNCFEGSSSFECIYTPDLNYFGEDSFTYIAYDGDQASQPSIVSLNVNPLPDAPIVGSNQEFVFNEDETLTFQLNRANDPDGEGLLFYSFVTMPTDGIITGCLQETDFLDCTFTPEENFNGEIEFTYNVSDGQSTSIQNGTVRLSVEAVNDAPVMISNEVYQGSVNSELSFILKGASDVDSSALTYSLVSAPSNGTLTGCLDNTSDLTCDFVPVQGFEGEVSFTYKSNDGELDSLEDSTVTLLISSAAPKVTQVATGFRHSCALFDNKRVRCWGDGTSGVRGYGNTDSVGDDELPNEIGYVDIGGLVKEISAGFQHTCALLVGGTVRCWGNGSNGVLGYGNTNNIGDNETPASAGDISLGGTAVKIKAGSSATCAILDTGKAKCWGNNNSGNLGYGNNSTVGDDEVPSDVGDILITEDIKDIAPSSSHTCVLLVSGKVICFGSGSNGRLGYGNTNDIGLNEAPDYGGFVSVGGNAVQIDTGGSHTCVLLDSGEVVCWGDANFGKLGYGNLSIIGDDELPSDVGTVLLGRPATSIATGSLGTCAVLDNDKLSCWGLNHGHGFSDYIGDNETPETKGYVPVGEDVQNVSLTHQHSCVSTKLGNVRCWGTGYNGQLGYGNRNNVSGSPSILDAGDVSVGESVSKVITSFNRNTCALQTNSKVRCWGWGLFGQLGYGNTESIGDDEVPSSVGEVDLGEDVLQLSKGGIHRCALLASGNVKCWGRGLKGELGYANTDIIGDNELPSSVGYVNVGGSVTDIAAGSNHTCVVLDNGKVRCWGRGIRGALGYGNFNDIGDNEHPANAGDIDLGGSAVSVRTGDDHSCALMDNGNVRCWGRNNFGQLGYGNTVTIGDNEHPSSAGVVELGAPAIQLSAGANYNCAVLQGGNVKCWGQGENGALGYGNTDNIGDDELPSSVGFVNIGGSAIMVSAGYNHACVLLDTGKVRCWGQGEYGSLGQGNVDNIGDDEVPSSISEVNIGEDVSHVSAGFQSTCVTTISGKVRCWGYNGTGELGYGNLSNVSQIRSIELAGNVALTVPVLDAVITADIELGSSPLNVNFSAGLSSPANSGQPITSYEWVFGDGQTGSGENISHLYTSVGIYNAELKITDSAGFVGYQSLKIEVVAPPIPSAIATFNQPSKNASSIVTFNGSGSLPSSGASSIVSYSWDFGDGNYAEGVSATNTYVTPSVFTAKLTVVDNLGRSSSTIRLVPVQYPLSPVSDFSYNPVGGKTPVEISFNGSLSTPGSFDGSITNYFWDFGDGTSSNDPQPSHLYSSAGTFKVELTVTDDRGNTDSKNVFIGIQEEDRALAVLNTTTFKIVPTEVERNSSLSFISAGSLPSDTVGGSISSYLWEFSDDNTRSSLPNIDHTFSNQGATEVKLTITDNLGKTDTASVIINVNPLLPPIARLTDSSTSTLNSFPVVWNFNASSSSVFGGKTIDHFEWDFGDGNVQSTSTGLTSHTFTMAGSFNVKVKVVDSDGEFHETTNIIVVNDSFNLTLSDLSYDLFVDEKIFLKSLFPKVRSPLGLNLPLSFEWLSSNNSIIDVSSESYMEALSEGDVSLNISIEGRSSNSLSFKVKETNFDQINFAMKEGYFAKNRTDSIKGNILNNPERTYVQSTFSSQQNKYTDSQGTFYLPINYKVGDNQIDLVATDFDTKEKFFASKNITFFDGIGNSLLFDGVNDLAEISGESFSLPTNEFSISFWMRRNNLGKNSDILKIMDSSKLNPILLKGLNTGELLLESSTSLFPLRASAPVIKNNSWTHITVSFSQNPGLLSIHYDGVLVNQRIVLGDLNIPSNGLTGVLGGEGFSGIIDEIRVWNKSLNPLEIKEEMFNPAVSSDPRSIAHFNFDGLARQTYSNLSSDNLEIVRGKSSGYEEEDPSIRFAIKEIASKEVISENGGLLSVVEDGGILGSGIKSNKISLDFPIDSLRDEAALVSVELVDSKTPGVFPDEIGSTGLGISIFPSSITSLKKSAVLYLPFDKRLLGNDELRLYQYNLDNSIKSIEPIKVDIASETASFPIWTMGTFSLSHEKKDRPEISYLNEGLSESVFDGSFFDKYFKLKVSVSGSPPYNVVLTGNTEGAYIYYARCGEVILSPLPSGLPFTLNGLSEGTNTCQVNYALKINNKDYFKFVHIIDVTIDKI